MDFYKWLKRKLGKAHRLSFSDWWTLTQAWVLLSTFDLALRWLPFRRVEALGTSGRKAHRSLLDEQAIAAAHRLENLVDIAARNRLEPKTCLRRSLTLQWLLGRRGVHADLKIGVNKKGDKLLAHAWLEYNGQPLIDPQEVSSFYTPLFIQESGQ